VAEYGNEKKASVIVEAYRHGTPRDAFGIYSQERRREGNFLEIGAQGYIDNHILNFVYGSYYVKINSFETGADDREILQAVAKRVAESLGEKGSLPAILSAFPPEGKRVIPKNTSRGIFWDTLFSILPIPPIKSLPARRLNCFSSRRPIRANAKASFSNTSVRSKIPSRRSLKVGIL
jgi:hypothetical protein